jgi:hypothetical protein
MPRGTVVDIPQEEQAEMLAALQRVPHGTFLSGGDPGSGVRCLSHRLEIKYPKQHGGDMIDSWQSIVP